MKVNTAVRKVLERKDLCSRASVATFLRRYVDRTRPVTGWWNSGKSTPALLDFIETLGLVKDSDYELVESTLDPTTVQIRWKDDAATRLTDVLTGQPEGWLDRTLRSLCTGQTLPDGALKDMDATESAPESGQTVLLATSGFKDHILERTAKIIDAMLEFDLQSDDNYASTYKGKDPDGDEMHCLWGFFANRYEASIIKEWLENAKADPDSAPPVLPLPVLEAYAWACTKVPESLRDIIDWPDAPVFSSFDLVFEQNQCHPREIHRLVRPDERVPQGQVFSIPIEDQWIARGPDNADRSALAKYFSASSKRWASQSDVLKAGTWVEFNAPIRPSAEAMNFMLDARRAADYVAALYAHAYGREATVSPFTRLAIGNLFPDCPGIDELTGECDDEDDENCSLRYRIDAGTLYQYLPYYMGGVLITAPGYNACQMVLKRERMWTTGHKPLMLERTDGTTDRVHDMGLTVDELAKEWFAISHGFDPASRMEPVMPNMTAAEADATRRENLHTLREDLAMFEQNHDAMNIHSSPDNPRLRIPGEPGANPDWEPCNVFAQGLCAVLRRHFGDNPVPMVRGAPRCADSIIAGVWSGMTTDKSTTVPDDDTFPVFITRVIGADPDSLADSDKEVTSEALEQLHADPARQFRFPKRSDPSISRRYSLVVETNIDAKKYFDLAGGHGDDLRWRLHATYVNAFVMATGDPLHPMNMPTQDEFCRRVRDEYMSSYWQGKLRSYLTSRGFTGCFTSAGTAIDSAPLDFYPAPDCAEFPVSVGWTADRAGRMVLHFSVLGPAFQHVRVPWRFRNHLPVVTTVYLKNLKGLCIPGLFPYKEGEDASSRYARYVKAEMCNGIRACGGETGPLALARGLLTAVYSVDETSALDDDETPDRDWYDPVVALDLAEVVSATR